MAIIYRHVIDMLCFSGGFFPHLTYIYVSRSAGLKVTPLTIGVYPRKAVEAELTDDGFIPPLIRIDEGNAVNWIWASCGIPRTISEAKFSHKTGALVQRETEER